ncbi:MAG TPA: Fur family transcriptional regulator [Anaerolineales bacterium]|jgi:Fe2+ or Zn2+ uptake regulation protein|nr:Fur family transcriptional regulator [Anaerolineales bacterium]
MSTLANKWLHKLQDSGCRLTQSRRVVIEILANSEHTLSPTEVFDLARERYASLGLVTVYRTLTKLEELDLIQQVHQPDGCEAYIASRPGHQHLLICQGCGRTEYFWGDKLDGLMTRVESESGFLIQDHWLQLFGLCVDCQKNAEGE